VKELETHEINSISGGVDVGDMFASGVGGAVAVGSFGAGAGGFVGGPVGAIGFGVAGLGIGFISGLVAYAFSE